MGLEGVFGGEFVQGLVQGQEIFVCRGAMQSIVTDAEKLARHASKSKGTVV
jgi:hypothetical protein